MSAIPFVSRPLSAPSYAPPAGELVAATPLGRDADGKNLTAYIVRSDTSPPPITPILPRSANANTPQDIAPEAINQDEANQANERLKKQPRQKAETPARFVKPDYLLSNLEQAQLSQLRAREGDVTDDAQRLNDDKGNTLLTSLIYDRGPDGRNYAVGVSAPLLAQKNRTKSRIQILGSLVQQKLAHLEVISSAY
jgi:hypothetical protein